MYQICNVITQLLQFLDKHVNKTLKYIILEENGNQRWILYYEYVVNAKRFKYAYRIVIARAAIYSNFYRLGFIILSFRVYIYIYIYIYKKKAFYKTQF